LSGWDIQAIGSSKWDTDSWDPGIPVAAILGDEASIKWESDGGLFRRCSNSAVWQFVNEFIGPDHSPSGTFSITTTYPWSGSGTYTCTSSNPRYACTGGENFAGDAEWIVGLAG
jgi:hypothetical protein